MSEDKNEALRAAMRERAKRRAEELEGNGPIYIPAAEELTTDGFLGAFDPEADPERAKKAMGETGSKMLVAYIDGLSERFQALHSAPSTESVADCFHLLGLTFESRARSANPDDRDIPVVVYVHPLGEKNAVETYTDESGAPTPEGQKLFMAVSNFAGGLVSAGALAVLSESSVPSTAPDAMNARVLHSLVDGWGDFGEALMITTLRAVASMVLYQGKRGQGQFTSEESARSFFRVFSTLTPSGVERLRTAILNAIAGKGLAAAVRPRDFTVAFQYLGALRFLRTLPNGDEAARVAEAIMAQYRLFPAQALDLAGTYLSQEHDGAPAYQPTLDDYDNPEASAVRCTCGECDCAEPTVDNPFLGITPPNSVLQ